MSGRNTTGQPDTGDYNLGRGILYFALLNTAGKPIAWRDMGNAPEFNITLSSETLEHQSSRAGLKITDKEVVLSQSVEISFTLDELNNQNIAALFSGEEASHTNVAIAGFAEFQMVADGDLQLGMWYDIVNSSGERAYDIDKTKLTVKTSAGSPVTLTQNTDYTVDETMGRFFIIATSSAVATAIGAGDGLLVTLTADAGAKGVEEVRALTRSSIRGALKFVADNPANDGEKTEYQFHQVTLKADGDISLIGDDWTTLPFTGKSERNAAADPDAPYCRIRNIGA